MAYSMLNGMPKMPKSMTSAMNKMMGGSKRKSSKKRGRKK